MDLTVVLQWEIELPLDVECTVALMIKTIVLLNVAFKWLKACQWDPNDRAYAGWKAGKSISQRDWLRRQHKFYWTLRNQKLFFFSRLKRDVFFNFCVCHKKRVSGKHSIRENNFLFSLKTESGKRTVIGTCVFYSICINLENIKKKQFWARTISATHKKRGQKNYFKKMDSSKKTTVRLSKKKHG